MGTRGSSPASKVTKA